MVLLPQYKSQTGQVTELKYMLGSGELRRLNYAYDVFGNLRRQTLNSGQTQEDLAYDSLQRLVSSIRSGAASGTTSYAYDVVGNFTSKSDFSTTAANAYTYTGGSCGGGPNAVKSIALAAGGTRTYCYDANGNLTSDNAGLAIRYDHMNMAVQASRGSQSDTFRYGSDGKRTRSWGADGSRVYLPGYEHRTDTGETKVYVGDYAVITRTGTTRKVDYLLKDRLGSVDAVANATGSITEARGYDPFGKPRDGTWADRTPAALTSRLTTPKGFTQHEHLDALELIHMNGRVFEYHMGRFTGVDPFIQFPLNSQSLNPYSYILNNPLSGTDPTGYRSICVGNSCNAVYDFTEKNATIEPIIIKGSSNGALAFSASDSRGVQSEDQPQELETQYITGVRPDFRSWRDLNDRSSFSGAPQLSRGQRVAAGGNAILSAIGTAGCAYGAGVACAPTAGVGCVVAAVCVVLGADITASETMEAVSGQPQTPALAFLAAKATGMSEADAEQGEYGLLTITSLANLRNVAQGLRGPSAVQALPAPYQIEAAWGSGYYQGQWMSGMQHVLERHAFNTSHVNVSRFLPSMGSYQIMSMVDEALRFGRVTPRGATGFVIDYNTGRVIGVDQANKATQNLRVYVKDGIIRTAFPY